ncbi:MAG: flavin reductase [Sphingobacteriia bacterium]|nr:flavin reductase [Sphingobacteriia bacterium]
MASDFNEKEFKECLSHYSTGIVIVTTKYEDNLYGLTVNSFTSVSLKPPLILFCIDKSASSLDAFLKSDSFAISILSSSQHEIAQKFANSNNEKWKSVKYVFGATGSPIILPNLSFMECEKFATYEAGDHYIIIGKVITLEVEKSEKKNPLIYFRGMYHHSPEAI